MLYVFSSSAGGRITYTEAVGAQLLRLIDKAPAPRGVIENADIPTALQRLERAVGQERATAPPPPSAGRKADDEDEKVSLAQRVAPLAELLRRAQVAGKDVTWGL